MALWDTQVQKVALLFWDGVKWMAQGTTASQSGQAPLFAVINASASGDTAIVAADATRKIKVLNYVFVCSGTVTVTWKDGAGTALSGPQAFVANTGVTSPSMTPKDGHLFETGAGQSLVMNLDSNVQVGGHLSYFLEA